MLQGHDLMDYLEFPAEYDVVTSETESLELYMSFECRENL
jgi:hypothetical protein